MTTTMEENEMNESSQIRERLLAKTRQHFFAASTTNNPNQQNNNPCRCKTKETRSEQTGV